MRRLICAGAMALVSVAASNATAQEDEGEVKEIKARAVGDEAPATEAGGEAAGDTGRSPIDAVKGHFGLGYFTGQAPIGMRYWFDREMALDLGLHLAFASGNAGAQQYGLEGGFIYALAHFHYAVVFTRLGVSFTLNDSLSDDPTPFPATWTLGGTLFLGAELFLGAFGFPNVSLQGGYGLEAAYTQVGGGGGAVVITTATGGLSVVGTGTFGFHIYL